MHAERELEAYLLAALKTADLALREAAYELEAAGSDDSNVFPARVVVQEAIKKLEGGFYAKKYKSGSTLLAHDRI